MCILGIVSRSLRRRVTWSKELRSDRLVVYPIEMNLLHDSDRLSVVALFWVRKLTAWHFVVLIWDLAIASLIVVVFVVSHSPRAVYNNFVTYKICLYRLVGPFTDLTSPSPPLCSIVIGPRVGSLRVVCGDSPCGFFRVPLTQVYPMALRLSIPLSLSHYLPLFHPLSGMGPTQRDNKALEIIWIIFFRCFLWGFFFILFHYIAHFFAL